MSIDLNDAFYFVQVVEKGGFSAAARALNIPKSRLSRRVRQLEDGLSVRLLQRTSRIVTATEVGEEYYRHARDALARFEIAETAVRRKPTPSKGQSRYPVPWAWRNSALIRSCLVSCRTIPA